MLWLRLTVLAAAFALVAAFLPRAGYAQTADAGPPAAEQPPADAGVPAAEQPSADASQPEVVEQPEPVEEVDASPPAPVEQPEPDEPPRPAPAPTPTLHKSTAERDNLDVLGMPVRFRVEPRFRARWSPDTSDRDVYGLLAGEIGDPRLDRLSAVMLGRFAWDVGRGPEEVGDELLDLDDRSASAYFRLYHGYAEARRLGPIAWARVGRMFLDSTPEWLHIDGARVRSKAWRAAGSLQLEVYGGLPVHFYQEERSGDVIAGAAAIARPWSGGRLRADWTYLGDDNYTFGQDDHLYGVGVWQAIGSDLSLYAAAHGVDDEARDVRGHVSYFCERCGLSGRLGYFQLLRTRRRLALSIDRFSGLLFEENEFSQVTGQVEKQIGAHAAVAAGADVRTIINDGDGTPLNRAYQRYWIGPRLRDWPLEALEIGAAAELWNGVGNMGGDVITAGGDVTYRYGRTAKLRAGTDYARYRYDFFLGQERVDSRRYFASAEGWYRSWGLRGRVRYELEDTDMGTFHTLWLSTGVSR